MTYRIRRFSALLLAAALLTVLLAACAGSPDGAQSGQTSSLTSTTAQSTAASTAPQSSSAAQTSQLSQSAQTSQTTASSAAQTTSSASTAATSGTSASSSQSSTSAQTTAASTAAPETDYDAVFAEYGIEPADALVPWAVYFVDNFPVEECDVRFVDLADGDAPEMLVSHLRHDENGQLTADLYLCAETAEGGIAPIWTYRLTDNGAGQYRAAYLIDFDGEQALLMYRRSTLKGTTTERYDSYRFDADGQPIQLSAEETSFPEAQVYDTALFEKNYASHLRDAVIVMNFPSPWQDAVLYDESLPAFAFAGKETPQNALRREGDNLIGISSCTVQEASDTVTVEGYALRSTGKRNADGRYVYEIAAAVSFECPGDTPVFYLSENGSSSSSILGSAASAALTDALRNGLSASGSLYYDGTRPVYLVRTENGEILSLTES